MQIWEYFIVYISCTSQGIRHVHVDILAYALFIQLGFLFWLFSGNLPWVSSAYTNRRVHTRPSYNILQFELNQFSYLFCFICQFCTNNIVPSKSESTRKLFFFFFFPFYFYCQNCSSIPVMVCIFFWAIYEFANQQNCQERDEIQLKKKWTSITSFISIIFFFKWSK